MPVVCVDHITYHMLSSLLSELRPAWAVHLGQEIREGINQVFFADCQES